MTVTCIASLCGLLLQSDASAATQPAPRFRITTIEGRSLRAGGFEVDSSRSLTLHDARDLDSQTDESKAPMPHGLDDIALLLNESASTGTAHSATQPAASLEFYPELGGHIRGQTAVITANMDRNRVAVRIAGGATVEWAMNELAAVRFSAQPPTAVMTEFETRLKNRDKARDQLIVEGEGGVTTFPGSLEELGPSGWVFRVGERLLKGGFDRAAGVVLAASDRRKEHDVILHTPGGDECRGQFVSSDIHGVAMAIGSSPSVRLSWEAVSRIEFRSSRVLFLSDMIPIESEGRGWFGAAWPVQRDRSTLGRPITLGGRMFAKGLGVHSYSRLTYEVPPGFDRFAAIAGIDSAAGDRGDVVFRVRNAEKTLFASQPFRGGMRPIEVEVSLAGTTKLTLEVDFGMGLDIGDHAIWGHARLLRSRE